jgi:hypothetical protein
MNGLRAIIDFGRSGIYSQILNSFLSPDPLVSTHRCRLLGYIPFAKNSMGKEAGRKEEIAKARRIVQIHHL